MRSSLSLVTATLADVAHHLVDAGDRRLRKVESDPRLATAGDVEALVRAQGVPEAKVWTVVDRMAEADLDPSAVWAWTMRHDATELADLVGTSLDDAALAAFIDGAADDALLRVA